MQEIYRFRRTGADANGVVQGYFEATGIRPRFAAQLSSHGLQLAPEIFLPHRPGGRP